MFPPYNKCTGWRCIDAGSLRNIGLTIPGNWSSEIYKFCRFCRWISCEIRQISPEIHTKSGGFHLKSARFHVKSTGCHEICMKSARFYLKSTGFHVKSTWNPPDFMNVSFWVITKYRSFFQKTKHRCYYSWQLVFRNPPKTL